MTWTGVAKRLFAALLAVLAAAPVARAQTAVVSSACVPGCGAFSVRVRDNPPEVQACLIRCNAGREFERGAGQARPAPQPARAMPAQPPPRAAAAAAPPPRPVPIATRPAAPPASPPAMATPPTAPSTAPGRATQLAAAGAFGGAAAGASAASTPAPAGRWGAAYVAAAPSPDFGLTVGQADRLAAHAHAQIACRTRGAACRPAIEFAERCGAVAQARRANGLFVTPDPTTVSVIFAAAGAGPTRAAAEAAALADCRARDRGNTCQVVTSACAGP